MVAEAGFTVSTKKLRATLLRTLSGHRAGVLSAKFTSDGTYCITASQDKTLILWNPTKGLLIKEYKGSHNHEVNDVTITQDKYKFASAGGDRSVNLWDVSEGRVVRKFIGHAGKVNCCEFSVPYNEVLCTGSYDKTVRLWDLKAFSKTPIQILNHAKDSITALIVNGSQLISGSVDGNVRTYDLRMGKMYADDVRAPIVSLSLSSDDDCMIVGCLDSTIRLLECCDGSVISEYRGHTAQQFKSSASFDPTDAFVVSGSEDHRICVWDLVEGAVPVGNCSEGGVTDGKGKILLSVPSAHGGPVTGVVFQKLEAQEQESSSTVLTYSADSTSKVWRLQYLEEKE